MICHTIWVSKYSFKCFKTVWSGLFASTLFSPCSYHLDRNGMLLKFLRILITIRYFKDRNWISKTVNCISCSLVCKIVFCSEFPDIPGKAGKVTIRRKRTQAIAKDYVFHANAIRQLIFSYIYILVQLRVILKVGIITILYCFVQKDINEPQWVDKTYLVTKG